jgi:hypothetical protein
MASAVHLWWREEDSNLRSRPTTDLQSVPFGHSGIPPDEDQSKNLYGAGDGTRTRNLLITSQLLCQLSYASKHFVFKQGKAMRFFIQKSEAPFINEFIKRVNIFLQNKLYTKIDKNSGKQTFFLHTTISRIGTGIYRLLIQPVESTATIIHKQGNRTTLNFALYGSGTRSTK